MILLANGIFCLLSAGWMVYNISQVQDQETNQWLQKFMWLYVSLLTLAGVHHLTLSIWPIKDDLLREYVKDGFVTIMSLTESFGGILFSLYLANRKRKTQMIYDNTI